MNEACMMNYKITLLLHYQCRDTAVEGLKFLEDPSKWISIRCSLNLVWWLVIVVSYRMFQECLFRWLTPLLM